MQVFVAMPLGEKEKKKIPGFRQGVRKASENSGVLCRFPNEIEKAGKITPSIIDEIRRSSAMIAEITDQNPNVIWEYGFASSIGKPVIPVAKSAKALFFDNKDDRAIIYKENQIELTLTQPLTSWLDDIRSRRPSFPVTDLIGTEPYTRATPVMGLDAIGNSPMGFYDLFKIAKKRVFAAAQNHWFLVNSMPQLQQTLLRFLSEERSRSFDLLMCDPKEKDAVRIWGEYVTNAAHKDHLDRASTAFAELEQWAKDQKLARQVRIKRVPFVPFSVTFVDPEENNGLMVVAPNAYEKLNKPRACFVISRLNGDLIFHQYYSAYSHILEL
jgi:hypothetical protein